MSVEAVSGEGEQLQRQSDAEEWDRPDSAVVSGVFDGCCAG